MSTINQSSKVKATVVTPLSIGQGQEKDWVEGIDYLWDKGDLLHLDLSRIVDAGIPVQTYSTLVATQNVQGVKNLLMPKIDDIYDFSMRMPVPSSNPVKTFYYNPVIGKYVLFGSSLKGALRSAIFHFLSKSEYKGQLLELRNRLDETIFGKMKDGTDFMRFIRVGDFNFDQTSLVNTKIYNLQLAYGRGEWEGGWKHEQNSTDYHFAQKGFNTVYECLIPGKSSLGSINISPLLYQKVIPATHKREKDFLMGQPGAGGDSSAIKNLFKIVNQYTADYLKKEITFFTTYHQGEKSDKILASLRQLEGMVTGFISADSIECLIKLSAGSGFHSVTGDWQYEDFTDTGYYEAGRNRGKKKYKSRKIACWEDKLSPMGFLKLSLMR